LKVASDLTEIPVAKLQTELTSVLPSAPLSEVVAVLRQKNAYEVFILEDSKVYMISIRDIIRTRNIHSRKISSLAVRIPTLTRENNVAEAAKLMREYRVRALPIAHGSEVIGEITALSICQALSSSGRLNFLISRIMTDKPTAISVEDRLGKAKAVINRRNIDHLPVLDGSRVVGILTSQRILDSMVPPEKPRRRSRTPEARRLNRLSVKGLMENPFICDVRDEASSVLGQLLDGKKAGALIAFN
jgi:CBS domain-containing protein